MNLEKNTYLRSIFVEKGEKLKFKMGQSLSDDKYLSGSVYFIEKGSARVIYKLANKYKTINKISSGACVGGVSLVRNSPCENIRASTELIAYKISDQEFKNLYCEDFNFRSFFDSYIYDSEVIDLTDYLIKTKDPRVILETSPWDNYPYYFNNPRGITPFPFLQND